MATESREARPVPELRDGDRMTQPEFHAAYVRAPEGVRAELIAGRVHVASPMKLDHGRNTPPLNALFTLYESVTPGIEVAEGATVILGDEDEPQPDLLLRVLPECGGRSRTSDDGYCQGPPELVVEVSDATRGTDLGAKRRQYAAHGVLEYLVFDLRDRRLRWFDLAADREPAPDADGVYRLAAFPGLRIDSAALLARDLRRLFGTLRAGLDSPEHAAFVARLAAARRPG